METEMQHTCLANLRWIVLVVTLASSSAYAQGGVERVCSGELTDMRVVGLTLGDCDLNSITDRELSYIKHVCGEPGTIDNNKITKCALKVITSRRKSIPPENHGYGPALYRVQKVIK